jgi:23S rRNA (adenine2503-C2)-methyltransferase
LTSGEIVEQVIWHARRLKKNNEKLTNVVIMGMGEPFLNFDNVLSAIYRLNHKDGFSLGKRRFTVSTAGIIPGINRFAREEDQVNLAVSLHAAHDRVRSTLMPINRKYPLSDLMAACRDYIDKTHRRVSFEWALIDGVNDRPADAQELISLLRGMLCHVNLILLNPTDKYRRNASSNDAAQQFKLALDHAHIPCTIRSRRGLDIQAGCGQLAGKAKSS